MRVSYFKKTKRFLSDIRTREFKTQFSTEDAPGLSYRSYWIVRLGMETSDRKLLDHTIERFGMLWRYTIAGGEYNEDNSLRCSNGKIKSLPGNIEQYENGMIRQESSLDDAYADIMQAFYAYQNYLGLSQGRFGVMENRHRIYGEEWHDLWCEELEIYRRIAWRRMHIFGLINFWRDDVWCVERFFPRIV